MTFEEEYLLDRWPNPCDENGDLKPEYESLFPAFYRKRSTFHPVSFLQTSVDSSDGFEPLLTEAPSKPEITILLPRPKQNIIPSGKDFYIAGKINTENPIPDDATFELTIYHLTKSIPDAMPERRIRCYRKDDKENLYYIGTDTCSVRRLYALSVTNKDNPEFAETVVKNSCCPDLVCSTDELPRGTVSPVTKEEALSYTWNKAYFTDTFFAALVYGGEYGKVAPFNKANIRPTDQDNRTIEPLREGEYEASIIIRSPGGGEAIVSGTHRFTIGHRENTIVTCFNYPKHIDIVRKNEEKWEGTPTLIWDPMPGFWVTELINDGDFDIRKNEPCPFLDLIVDGRRPVFNDIFEYQHGDFVFYNYGVRSFSAALRVEIAEIFHQRRRGKNLGLTTLAYTSGEPGVVSTPSGSLHEDNALLGPFHSFSGEGPVMLTRIGVVPKKDSNTDENAIDERYTTQFSVNDDFYEMSTSSKLCVFGVCSIPDQEIFPERDHIGFAYNIELPQQIKYRLTHDLNSSDFIEVTKPVFYTSQAKAGEKAEKDRQRRILEFKHVFDFSQYPTIQFDRPLYVVLDRVLYSEKPDGDIERVEKSGKSISVIVHAE